VDITNLDLDKLSSNVEPVEMELLHPTTGQPLESDGKKIKFSLVGSDSPAYLKAERAVTNARLQAAQRLGKRGKVTSEVIEDGALDILAASTTGWTPFQFKGELFTFSNANAKRLYKEAQWIREQVDAFVHDRGNFLKN